MATERKHFWFLIADSGNNKIIEEQRVSAKDDITDEEVEKLMYKWADSLGYAKDSEGIVIDWEELF